MRFAIAAKAEQVQNVVPGGQGGVGNTQEVEPGSAGGVKGASATLRKWYPGLEGAASNTQPLSVFKL